MSERNENEVDVFRGLEGKSAGKEKRSLAERKERRKRGKEEEIASSSFEVGNLGKPAMFGDQADQRSKMDEADNYRETYCSKLADYAPVLCLFGSCGVDC